MLAFIKSVSLLRQLSSTVASMSGSCFKKICSINCMASCLVLLEDTAVIMPAGSRSVEADVEISLSLTVAISCRDGQLMLHPANWQCCQRASRSPAVV